MTSRPCFRTPTTPRATTPTLPEEIDSEYQAVFKEMEAVCGIEVSVMENLGRFSN